MNDKEQLLDAHDLEQKKEHNIPLKQLIFVYAMLIFACLVFMPKIYIANQVYYISKEIGNLKNTYEILVQENRILKSNLEQIQFKNQIADPMSIK